MHRRAAQIAVLATLAAWGCCAPAHARPLSQSMRAADAQIDWSNVRRAERMRVLARWARAPDVLAVLIRHVASRLTISRTVAGELGGGNYAETDLDPAGETWRIGLSEAVLQEGSKLHAHLTLHELGHVIDGALVDDAIKHEFFALFGRASGWQSCFPMPPGSSSRCVRGEEIFADQFAFWATGTGDVRSSYGIPPLAGRWDYAALIARMARRAR